MNKNNVNQETIARLLNLSRSTVTKVLNHDPVYRVSAETRDLILRTASEIGFRPRRRRTGNISFVVSGEVHSAMHETHQAVCREADVLGYRVFFVNKDPQPTYRDLSLCVNPLSADGAILIGDIDPEIARQLASVMPVVVVDAFDPMFGVDNTRADHRLLARRLNEFLIDRGHRSTAIIVDTRTREHNVSALDGCRDAQKAAAICFDESLVWEKRDRLYPKLIKQVLEHPASPSAILAFTTSDHPVILSTLFSLGYSTPERMCYVGWAESHFSSLAAFPEITCIDSYYRTMAETAVRRLMKRIDERNIPAESVVIDLNIRNGQTCTFRAKK